ncbi:MAG: DUF3849 domain-containing protein [Clostridiales bacterium]|nr:DUF3849 domain-containing protein [Clostridiales bacterium]
MAGNREEQLKEITERLEQGVEEYFTSERYAEYLKVMSKFHTYSFKNTLLITMQKPDATLVAGYQAWQKKFHRQVKRGEKGIQIISPVPIRRREERGKLDEVTGEAVLNPDGEPETEEVVRVIPRFKVATVFDVSQTIGDPLPELGGEELTDSVKDYDLYRDALMEISPVPVRFTTIESGAKGFYDSEEKEIVIQPGMSESQTLKTLIHESVHARLHDREMMLAQEIEKSRMTREVEAESVAYTVCQAFGIDTSEYSFPYVASWSSGLDMKELRASMDTIRHTSAEFIDSLTQEIQMQLEQRAQAMESAQYQTVEIFKVPALFSDGQIPDNEVPDGFYRYDLRHSSEDVTERIRVENNVAVNYAGTILSVYPLNLPERGYDNLGDGFSFTGERISFGEYRQRMEAADFSVLAEEMQDAVVHANEELLWEDNTDRYAIYQIDGEGNGRDYSYMNMDFINSHGMAVKGRDYQLVYGGFLEEGVTLEDLYEKFNVNHPPGYTGHSLSVSDVVITKRGGEVRADFVDSVGFAPLPEFAMEREELWKRRRMRVTDFTKAFEIDGHEGLWHTMDQISLMGEDIFLMEHNEFGSDVAKVAVNQEGKVVAEDLWNGFDEDFHRAASEYFAEKGISYEQPSQELQEGMDDKTDLNVRQEELQDESVEQRNAETMEEEAANVLPVAAAAVPVYMQTGVYAFEHGEMKQYRESRAGNLACKMAIKQAIGENFDGMHLNKDAVKGVLTQFGAERVSYVLAATIQKKDWDGRFSPQNKAWAASIPTVEDISGFGDDVRDEFVVESHPAVLDGFVRLVRDEIALREQEREKPLTADEITNFKEIRREYFPVSRTLEYQLSCEVRGEPDVLTYEISYHDNDEEGFTLHTQNNDIWERMGMGELRKLEAVVSREVTFFQWQRDIEEAPSADILREVRFGLWETENLNLSREQMERIYQMIDEKEQSLLQDSLDEADRAENAELTEESEKVSIVFYYVDSDMNGVRDENSHQEFPDVESALGAYVALPNHLEKEIGMESTEEVPSRMTLIRCKNGVDTLYDMEEESLSGKWVTPETIAAQNRAQFYLDNHDVAIAYYLESADKYFVIQTAEEGYDYTFYDASFHEIDGGVVGNTDVSISEAMEEILVDAGYSAWPGHREVIDCEALMENVRTVAQGEIDSVQKAQEKEHVDLISGRTEPLPYLKGRSMADVEETVLSFAQATLDEMGLHDEVKLHAARVYGSRCREGVYTENSDMDVVISYYGNLSAEDFAKVLNESGMTISGIPIDMKPVSIDEGVSLNKFLEESDRRLDVKESKQLAAQLDAFTKGYDPYEYKDVVDDPVQSVEEIAQSLRDGKTEEIVKWLDEVDDGPEKGMAEYLCSRVRHFCDHSIPIAEFPKDIAEEKEPEISFYVAECMEYPVLGEYYENLTLEEAVEKYRQIPAERMSGIKGIGFVLNDGSIYDGMQYEMMNLDVVNRDLVNEIPHYRDSSLVQKAMDDLEAIMGQPQTISQPDKEKNVKQSEVKETLQESQDSARSVVERSADTFSSGTRESVLQALKERQNRIKEQQKNTEERSKNRKKGERSL